jgi:hypothetical protein
MLDPMSDRMRRPMDPFDNPHYEPPVDIRGREARAYELKILALVREALLPSPGPLHFVESIELRGEQPETAVILRYRITGEPGLRAVRRPLWEPALEEHRNEKSR